MMRFISLMAIVSIGVLLACDREAVEPFGWQEKHEPCILLSPPDQSRLYTNRPKFKWEPVKNATAYQLQIDTQTDFQQSVICIQITESVYKPDRDLMIVEGCWRVRALYDDENDVPWSETWRFTLPEIGRVVDIDGWSYRTVKIGDQWWMAENLRVTHYRNGEAIPRETDANVWPNLSTGAYCTYGNRESLVDILGHLYNGYAVIDERGLAPAGWHVASDAEWKELEMYLGMSASEVDTTGWRGNDEGGKLKATSVDYWNSPNSGATNESAFSALPGGARYGDPSFYYGIGDKADFWVATPYSEEEAWWRYLGKETPRIGRGYAPRYAGHSVRCVKD
ncbi:fibrobacter succinogenes major paralogous domain-containing protein [candidate division KSB1 bacterium]|nr:fibrobacter succinogenes major paralogous domain-containing protein [candidate division KSB1 bacterium]